MPAEVSKYVGWATAFLVGVITGVNLPPEEQFPAIPVQPIPNQFQTGGQGYGPPKVEDYGPPSFPPEPEYSPQPPPADFPLPPPEDRGETKNET